MPGLLDQRQLYRDTSTAFAEAAAPVVGPARLAETQGAQLRYMREEGGAPAVNRIGGVLSGRDLSRRAKQQAAVGSAYAGEMASQQAGHEIAMLDAESQFARQQSAARRAFEQAQASAIGQVGRALGTGAHIGYSEYRKQQIAGAESEALQQSRAIYSRLVAEGMDPKTAWLGAYEATGIGPTPE